MLPLKPLSFDDPALLSRSAVVSASAGSGKTFTLTVMVLLALGRMEARPYEIIAATFSEAAAADLRERLLRPIDLLASLELDAWGELLPMGANFTDVLASLDISPRLSKSRAELAEAIPRFGAQPWMDAPRLAQSFWRRTRREAELMQVSTLHGLALGLLRAGNGAPDRILEADHPVLLRVLRQAMRETADVSEDHPDHPAAAALLAWAERQWREISSGHDAHRDAMGRLGGDSADESCVDLKNSLKKAQEALRPFADDPDSALDTNSRTRRYFDPQKILPIPKPGAPLPDQIRWAERQSTALGYPADSLQGYYATEFAGAAKTLAEVASAWEARLKAILVKALTRFEELKLGRGMATFGDIVRSALEGLKEGSIRSPRPKLLMVDEYQDTSRAQDAFLGALGADRIVRVGDVKQAIYGFRGGSPELLMEHIEAAEGSAYRLAANFRSAPPIVDMANAFVQKIWNERAAIEHPEADQEPQARGDSPVGAVLASGPASGTDLPALSQWIAALSHESGWESTVGGTSSDTPASTRALLLRQRTKLPALLIRLKRHGIHYYVLSKEGFWDSPGPRLLMTALEAFAYPSRPLPCAVLLRHFAGLSDGELHQMGEAPETEPQPSVPLNSMRSSLPPVPPGRSAPFRWNLKGIGDFDINVIPMEKRPRAAWLQGLKSASAQQIAACLLAQGNLLAIITSLDAHGAMEPSRARRNLAGFLAMLQDAPASLGAAFAMLDELRKGLERGDLPSTSQDADLVIQTVHGSKGLEYDDVILPLLNNRIQGVRKGRLFTDPKSKSLMLAWKLGNEPGKDYKRIADVAELQQRRDDLNLFYVAITRAKKRLCLLIQSPEKKAKDDARQDDGAKQTEGANISWAQLGNELLICHGKLLELEGPPPIQPPNQTQTHILEKPLNQIPLVEPQALPMPAPRHDQDNPVENLRSRQDGEAMHAYLQHLLVRWEDTEAFNRALNNPPPVTDARENALRFLGAIESRGWRYLHRRTEMNLHGASASGTKGRADLVIWDNGCIHIIDFKHTRELTKESEEAYTQQINRYARAISNQGIPIKGWLALLKSGEWKEVAVFDL